MYLISLHFLFIWILMYVNQKKWQRYMNHWICDISGTVACHLYSMVVICNDCAFQSYSSTCHTEHKGCFKTLTLFFSLSALKAVTQMITVRSIGLHRSQTHMNLMMSLTMTILSLPSATAKLSTLLMVQKQLTLNDPSLKGSRKCSFKYLSCVSQSLFFALEKVQCLRNWSFSILIFTLHSTIQMHWQIFY